MTDTMKSLLDTIAETADAPLVYAAGQVKAYALAIELVDGIKLNAKADPSVRAILTVISSALARLATDAADGAAE
jgi:hypothetical protein